MTRSCARSSRPRPPATRRTRPRPGRIHALLVRRASATRSSARQVSAPTTPSTPRPCSRWNSSTARVNAFPHTGVIANTGGPSVAAAASPSARARPCRRPSRSTGRSRGIAAPSSQAVTIRSGRARRGRSCRAPSCVGGRRRVALDRVAGAGVVGGERELQQVDRLHALLSAEGAVVEQELRGATASRAGRTPPSSTPCLPQERRMRAVVDLEVAAPVPPSPATFRQWVSREAIASRMPRGGRPSAPPRARSRRDPRRVPARATRRAGWASLRAAWRAPLGSRTGSRAAGTVPRVVVPRRGSDF